jgi:hypothetical protein
VFAFVKKIQTAKQLIFDAFFDNQMHLSPPEKKPMAVKLKSRTQKSIKAPLTDELRNETEDAPHTSLQKELNSELIDDVTFENDLEDTPSKDNEDMVRADVEHWDEEMMEMNDLDNANSDEPIVDGMELLAYGTLVGKKYTVSKIIDPTQLNPVKVNVEAPSIKRKGGDLLKRLHLDDILFEDNDDDVRTKKKQKGAENC